MNPSDNRTPLQTEEELTKLKNSLPKELGFDGNPMYLYQGFWAHRLDWIVSFQNHFQAQDTDILAASFRKVGTTWLKALLFAICDRANHPCSGSSPLLTHNPHKLVPHLESNIYANSKCPDLSSLKTPRLFGTHVPYPSLPSSITDSSKIIYISRNPFDTFVSSWMFYQTLDNCIALKQPDMLDQYFDMFSEGKVPFGPFPEHVLGYWKASLERPEKVLFVKYEDLKADPIPQLKRMAEFVGCPFTSEEAVGGVIDDIVKLCIIQNLKEVAESNKTDRVYPVVKNDKFFRKGEVGDWTNHMTPSMANRLEMVMEKIIHGSGFKYM